jgi:hypothetical protein
MIYINSEKRDEVLSVAVLVVIKGSLRHIVSASSKVPAVVATHHNNRPCAAAHVTKVKATGSLVSSRKEIRADIIIVLLTSILLLTA